MTCGKKSERADKDSMGVLQLMAAMPLQEMILIILKMSKSCQNQEGKGCNNNPFK